MLASLVAVLATSFWSGDVASAASKYRNCGKHGLYVADNPNGGYGLILFKLRVRGVGCVRGSKVAALQIAGRAPAGWRCVTRARTNRRTCSSRARRVVFTPDGSAG